MMDRSKLYKRENGTLAQKRAKKLRENLARGGYARRLPVTSSRRNARCFKRRSRRNRAAARRHNGLRKEGDFRRTATAGEQAEARASGLWRAGAGRW